jgi:molybdate transport system substrate-binding protein
MKKIIISSACFLIFCLLGCGQNKKIEIEAFCGSASKPAIEECADVFEKKTGLQVNLHFSGAGTMLSQMKMSKRGDIYIPASPDYMLKAERENIIKPETVRILAYLIPAICVQKGNPKNIQKLTDLAKPKIRLATGNPDSVCIGLYAMEILIKRNLLKKVGKNFVTFAGSGSKTAALLSTKAVDAILGWRVFAKWNPLTTEAVLLKPEEIVRIAYMPAGISTFSAHPKEAKEFIDFLTGEEGRKIFSKSGYLTTKKEAKKFAPKAKIGGEYKLPTSYISPIEKK